MRKEDLIEGEYYTITDKSYPGKVIIHKYERMDDLHRSYGYYISTYESNNCFRRSTPWLPNRTIKKSTPQEIDWLNECIKANRFISFEDAMKTFKKDFLIYETL
jgi:hypothetical protein